MTNIITTDVQSLIDRWLEAEQKGDRFPVPFDIAWTIAGYSEKGKGKRRLTSKSSYLVEGIDYQINSGVFTRSGKSELCGRSSDRILLSCDAFKQFCLIAETEQGRQIRQYFIECEKKWRIVQQIAPEVAEKAELEYIKLVLELEKERNKGKELDNTMLQLHGDRVVLALRGQRDQIVEKETIVTEVVEPETQTSNRILTAPQLIAAVKERSGQKLKTAKEFTDALRNLGRDDLIVPVTRHVTGEYVIPDRLDEAIDAVYGGKRQRLLGEK